MSLITGIGISPVGRRTGIPGIELTTDAARQAIADAGLTPADIDGVATLGDTPIADATAALGIEAVNVGEDYVLGGLWSPFMSAVRAIADGRVRHVLVYRTVEMLGGTMLGGGAPMVNQPALDATVAVMGDLDALMASHAYSAANWLALHCQRHMHVYGTTKEQLGWLAINSRRNAGLNPLAAYRDPITMDDYLGARPISTPLGLLDCDVPVDGSIALVVSPTDHAPDCPSTPIRVEAMGVSTNADGWVNRPDYPKMASVDAAADLWRQTSLTPADVDVAELYDGFTFLTFAWLEALGLCGDGEAGPFVEGATRIAFDGELPLNTYGGQLSAGRMHGYWLLHEACTQLRGDGGDRQVANAPEVAVAAAGGGPIAGAVLLTTNR